ncbi:MAG: catalase [Clostridia bacterium]|nr:catalase [Clostridia bacterium]
MLKNFFSHFSLVLRHKWRVFVNCCRCGIPWRGLVHDLSKFSPVEFFESVKYYQGDRSPIGACRRATGKSEAWLHHKGRNKHHIEYWYDPECSIMPMMPYKYAVECVCDKLAATYVYAGGRYENHLPLLHWNKHGKKVVGNPRTMEFIEGVFVDVEQHGEDYVLNKAYMKKKFHEVCEK